MPASMRRWCEGELKKITGKEDTTLVDFCYTLESAADIREYMRNYMGSKPQVSQFASEFLKRKKGGGGGGGGGSGSGGGSVSNSSLNSGKAKAGGRRRRRGKR